MAFSEASQSLTISQFGKFKVSLLFQFIIPLFLIFLSFNIYTTEITSGRLRLLLVQGNSLRKIVFAKILSLLSLATILLSITILLQLLFNFSKIELDQLVKEMVEVDLKESKKELFLKNQGYKIPKINENLSTK